MFNLITDDVERPLRERSVTSKIVAIITHGLVVLALVAVPLFKVTAELPRVVPAIMAFVAAQPAMPPPPPPPPAAALGAKPAPQPTRTTGDFAAPLESPKDIQPERGEARDEASAGVIGGIEGGVPGGVVGGVVGGIVSPIPPPPPLPPPVARGPVRIGGQVTAPALLRRVEPVYPDVAAMAHLGGIVILEATVATDGCVQSVKVLRSRHPLLDKASEEALMQWRYSPLMLNGTATPFVLTVTFSFAFR